MSHRSLTSLLSGLGVADLKMSSISGNVRLQQQARAAADRQLGSITVEVPPFAKLYKAFDVNVSPLAQLRACGGNPAD